MCRLEGVSFDQSKVIDTHKGVLLSTPSNPCAISSFAKRKEIIETDRALNACRD